MNEEQLKRKIIEENIRLYKYESSVYELLYPVTKNWYERKRLNANIDLILRQFDVESNPEIVDLGCGTGLLTFEFLKRGFNNIIAVDLSKEMIEILKNKIENNYQKIKIVNMECEQFLKENKERKFDVIVMSALLHHLYNYNDVLELSIECLKNKGILYISFEPLKKEMRKMKYFLHRIVATIDNLIFRIGLFLKGVNRPTVDSDYYHYQLNYGGIELGEIEDFLREKRGIKILKKEIYCVRNYGIFAWFCNRILRSWNNFSLILIKYE